MRHPKKSIISSPGWAPVMQLQVIGGKFMNKKIWIVNIIFLIIIGLATTYLFTAIYKMEPQFDSTRGYHVGLVNNHTTQDHVERYALQDIR